MERTKQPTFGRLGRRIEVAAAAVAACGVLVVTACGGSDPKTAPATTATSAVEPTTAPLSSVAPTTAVEATTAPPATTPATTSPGPATGEPMVVGLVNTEGTPGLDFPDIRLFIKAAADYLNDHGGLGGRPITIVSCTAKGSPETSQACAQELAGKKVEMVMLGLDLFPDYKTYAAADLPVIGVLPILPGDYSADALFLTGGNATVNAAIASVAKDHFKATSVGIVSSDNAGANASAAALEASLTKAGIAFKTVKGGDNETDAGYQGLMREATKDAPDLLVSLYSDAGCIGTMRGRAALAITTPVITTGICSSKGVLDEVGDDAVGWVFAGVQTDEDTPDRAILRSILAPVLGVPEEEVDANGLGLGGLGYLQMMSLADFANLLASSGQPVTGASLHQFVATSKDLRLHGGGAPIECGAAPAYPAICSFLFPFAEYLAGGEVKTIDGLEAVSSKELLP